MEYIVNDIENIILLDKIGVFTTICSKCDSMSITNIRAHEFSYHSRKIISCLKSKGLIEVNVDPEFYKFLKYKEQLLRELGIGDKSSIYLASKLNASIITDNELIYKIAKSLTIHSVYIDDFSRQFITDGLIMDTYNNLKIQHL